MSTVKLTLAIADEKDFRDMWKLYSLAQKLEQAWCMDDPETRARRCRWAIAERVMRMQSAFIRIGMGCEMLIREVCDPKSDSYALKPVMKAAPDLLDALEAFLRAPSVGSDGPGSSTIVVQDFNLRAAHAAVAKAKGGAA